MSYLSLLHVIGFTYVADLFFVLLVNPQNQLTQLLRVHFFGDLCLPVCVYIPEASVTVLCLNFQDLHCHLVLVFWEAQNALFFFPPYPSRCGFQII